MHLDIYQRPEAGGRLTFLAVPAGRRIPEEAASVDWSLHAGAMALDEDEPSLEPFRIRDPAGQLREKGYAITALEDQVPAAP